MQALHFPLKFTFKVTTLSNDFVARDAHDNTVAFVKQKRFKLKEKISVFTDESKSCV